MNIGDTVKLKAPFDDGNTYTITAIMGIDNKGVATQGDVAYYQYEVNGCYYIEEYIERVV